MQAINLIPASRREARRRRRYTRRWSAGVATYAGLLAAAWIMTHLLLAGPERVAADGLASLQQEAAEVREKIDELKPLLAETQTTLAASRSVGSQPNWSLLLALLANELGDHVLLTSLRLDPVSPTGATMDRSDNPAGQSHYRLRLSGIGRDQAVVSNYVLRLEQTQLFDKVTLIDTRREPFRETTAMGFRLECDLKP